MKVMQQGCEYACSNLLGLEAQQAAMQQPL
jgi:hypothetical protein